MELTPENQVRRDELIAILRPFTDDKNRVRRELFDEYCDELEALLFAQQETRIPRIKIEAYGTVTNPTD